MNLTPLSDGLLAETSTFVPGRLIWGAPQWLWPVAIIVAVMMLVLVWSYWRGGARVSLRAAALALKLGGIAAIAWCILEPLWSDVRPRPGANLFLVVADNSRSLTVRDQRGVPTRAEAMQPWLQDETPWLARLGQDFELRRYVLDNRLRMTRSFETSLAFDGNSTELAAALQAMAGQLKGRPVAGIVLLTDGNATDWNESVLAQSQLPPVYPVLFGEDRSTRDINVVRVTTSETNFETLPVTIQAVVECQGVAGEDLLLQLLDREGKEVQREIRQIPARQPMVHTFQLKPSQPGVEFYSVRALLASDEQALERPAASSEATLANNQRLAMIDRRRGPYRVLYVTGRPNWDFKFLRRAAAEDDEVQLVGLIRIAKKEPRFSFRGRTGETTNPLFRGFDNQTDPTAEQYDEPVLIRLGTKDAAELRDGFPKAAEELFAFHAVVLDDLEVEYFTRDQLSLIQQFVSQRGGSLLMMGGEESFGGGRYDRTPIGEMLPVYIERTKPAPPIGEYRLAYAREGWLQPWIRLRATEQEEQQRLAEMPSFRVWNAATGTKPGASVLIYAQPSALAAPADAVDGPSAYPALVTQKYGNGQTAALLLGDLWRWGMRSPPAAASDMERGWRQLIRWLVADVPHRVSVDVRRDTSQPGHALQIRTQVRHEKYEPFDNADVICHIRKPDQGELELTAVPFGDKAGEYVADFVPREPGAYQIRIEAKGPDGALVGTCESGATHEPTTDEFRSLKPNRELMETLAQQTGGEVLAASELDTFVGSLPNRKIPITEPWTYPLWHQWPVLGLAILCLAGEWGLRRWSGLP